MSAFMKKLLFYVVLFSMVWPLWAQQPQAISYQTVIRDAEGQLLSDTPVNLKITLRSGSAVGDVAYSEIHNAVTNSLGLITLSIGQGTLVEGNFATIQWGRAPHFLETAIDLTGSGQYQTLGVTQLLSVPYSLYSGQTGSLMAMTNQERDALINPAAGMQIYNVTTNCLNYYNGTDWFETCGSLIVNQPPEMPFVVSPPDGATGQPFDITLQWGCVDPDNDPVLFDVFFGPDYPPNLIQPGVNATSYTINQLPYGVTFYWKIAARDNHNNVTDSPVWSFQTIDCQPPQPYAGEDAWLCETESYLLAGAMIPPGSIMGGWTTSGDGTFSDPMSISPSYTPGNQDIQNGYVALMLTAYTAAPCPSLPGYDYMYLNLQHVPAAFAGNDTTVCEGDEVTLSDAFAANYDYVSWYTFDGSGFFDFEYSQNPVYYPSVFDWSAGCIHLVMVAYALPPCGVPAYDTLELSFMPMPIANAGPDQINHSGTSTTLAGNTPPTGGYGQWSIQSGAGGSIAQPNNPASQFTGVAGNTYVLLWRLYTWQGCDDWDEVTISFAPNWSCGQSFTDTRDGKSYTTLQLGTQCWMKQNLNIGTRIAGTSNQTNNSTIEKYCYNNSESNCTTYGGLYQWNEMMQYTTTAGVKGICPTGWHLPTDAEWTTLTTYISGQSAYRCNSNSTYIAKAMASTSGWTTYTGSCAVGNNQASNNTTGFTGLPGGTRSTDGSFYDQASYGYWWSSSQNDSSDAWYRNLYYSDASVYRYFSNKAYGFSVRCLKD